jgi:hypothetical protein
MAVRRVPLVLMWLCVVAILALMGADVARLVSPFPALLAIAVASLTGVACAVWAGRPRAGRHR